MSTFTAPLSPGGMFSGQLPAIWDCPEFFPESPKPIVSTPCSDEPDQNPVLYSSGSDEPEQNLNAVQPESGSAEPEQTQNPSPLNSGPGNRKRKASASVTDERKLRRKISNRESARRSRVRKQRHLENLRNQVNRLRMDNRVLTNRLRFVLYHYHRVRTDNERMRLEHVALQQRLGEIRQVLAIRQMQQQFSTTPSWPCTDNNAYVTSEQQIPSLITY